MSKLFPAGFETLFLRSSSSGRKKVGFSGVKVKKNGNSQVGKSRKSRMLRADLMAVSRQFPASTRKNSNPPRFRTKTMPRICARESCGKRLVRKDGSRDYHRHFCGSECKNADKWRRLQVKTPPGERLVTTTAA